jgi:starvation-inducible DNA-binding protein
MIIDQLKTLLADHIESALTVQGYHWNVTGPDFNQYHDFFGSIYDMYYDEVDKLAEYIRIVSAGEEYVTATVDVVKTNKTVKSVPLVGNQPMEMTKEILVLNDVLITELNKLFDAASKENEQGLADYCAGQIDVYKKLKWKLKVILK